MGFASLMLQSPTQDGVIIIVILIILIVIPLSKMILNNN